ncbi:hypothetical protein D0Y65_029756 [Glycine soja]|uniref:Uncharacterized protein n=1 Tax=Glycine soja TaxID=3848 RepID=A0A445I0R4_GLYSO|nr:hypothetical protein D0Y65_029756 [Glycine soja]RZB79646.1 hypothetical protein D0Y65_029756 [Glycine soja]RZB79647.1 hypothetical protein D0Y65_029756 [Glycine soja]RZB79648.1 hypothetical protein D0Y65_029756 [Glycine soja]
MLLTDSTSAIRPGNSARTLSNSQSPCNLFASFLLTKPHLIGNLILKLHVYYFKFELYGK